MDPQISTKQKKILTQCQNQQTKRILICSDIYEVMNHATKLKPSLSHFTTLLNPINLHLPIMEYSVFTVSVMMMLLLGTGHLQRAVEAQLPTMITCDPVELSWCLQAIVSIIPPTPKCCKKLKGQESCLCTELGDPTFGGFLELPGFKNVCTTCNVTFPDCMQLSDWLIVLEKYCLLWIYIYLYVRVWPIEIICIQLFNHYIFFISSKKKYVNILA